MIKQKKLIIENWSRFVIFNLQEIGELIRENEERYDYPTIDKLKDTDRYKEIIARFQKFIDLWDKMLKAKKNFNSYNSLNNTALDSKDAKIIAESEDLHNKWTYTTAELHNFIAEYLSERGLSVDRAIVLNSYNEKIEANEVEDLGDTRLDHEKVGTQ